MIVSTSEDGLEHTGMLFLIALPRVSVGTDLVTTGGRIGAWHFVSRLWTTVVASSSRNIEYIEMFFPRPFPTRGDVFFAETFLCSNEDSLGVIGFPDVVGSIGSSNSYRTKHKKLVLNNFQIIIIYLLLDKNSA